MRSTNGGTDLHPVKTRVEQTAPRPDENVIMIADGTHSFSHCEGFFGKGLITAEYDFSKIDYINLLGIGDAAQYSADDAISIDDMQFKAVPHYGLCGYDSLAIGVDLVHVGAGKELFLRLVKDGFYQNVDDTQFNNFTLPQAYWLTSDGCKCNIT